MFGNNRNNQWIEKYRPITLDEVISQENIINTLKETITKRRYQHILLHGPSGTGKTSTIMACARELYGNKKDLMTIYINASEERGIEIVRTRIQQFVTTKNIFSDDNYFKLVILDEADAMTHDAQAILRKVIENYADTTRFCIICNYIKKISSALQSRCICYRFAPIMHKKIEDKIMEISNSEKVKITQDGIKMIIKITRGDMRKAINILQSASLTDTVIDANTIVKCTGYITNEDIDRIIKSLFTDEFTICYKTIYDICKINSYALNDIITETTNIIIGYITRDDNYDKRYDIIFENCDKTKLLDILYNTSNIEFNLISCVNDRIQLSAFISYFIYHKHKE